MTLEMRAACKRWMFACGAPSLLVLAACAPSRYAPPPLSAFPFPVDSSRSEIVADGVAHRYLYTAQGPWAVHVLYVDLNRCVSAVAVKGADSAAGRTKTSELLQSLSRSLSTRASVLG